MLAPGDGVVNPPGGRENPGLEGRAMSIGAEWRSDWWSRNREVHVPMLFYA